MRLESLVISNFRSCREVKVEFDAYTCMLGPNGAGKSTVLTALNILFRNSSASPTNLITLSEEDFCGRDPSHPIAITATFGALSSEAVEDFRAYVRHGKLIVKARAEWNKEKRTAEVKQYGARLVMKAFAEFFEALGAGAKAAELKDRFAALRREYPGIVPAATKGDMENALRSYEEAHPESCEIVDSESQFYGWSKGSNRLGRYIQWVYVPAVKDASEEQLESRNTALGELLQRTIRSQVDFEGDLSELRDETLRRYTEIVGAQQEVLANVSRAIEGQLQTWAHPGAKVDLRWSTESERQVVVAPPIAKAAVGEGGFLGEVGRLGHGMQRAFIVSVLQVLAANPLEGAPTLLLGIEEPELYQHPPQARHLAKTLEELAGADAQVIVTTHSPYFVSGRGFEAVRMVRKVEAGTTVTSATYAGVSRAIAVAMGEPPRRETALVATVEQILQPSQNEMFFCAVPVLVEGLEDIAYVASYMQLTGQWADFRRYGCHFVIADGKNKLSRPLAIANLLKLPAFVVFDGDCDRAGKAAENIRDNGCLLRLCGVDAAPLSNETVWSERLTMWADRIGDQVQRDVGKDLWNRAEAKARVANGWEEDVQRKNSLLVAATLEEVVSQGVAIECLGRLSAAILRYASETQETPVHELVS